MILVPVSREDVHAVRQLADLTEIPNIIMYRRCAGQLSSKNLQGNIIVLGQIYLGADVALVDDLAACRILKGNAS